LVGGPELEGVGDRCKGFAPSAQGWCGARREGSLGKQQKPADCSSGRRGPLPAVSVCSRACVSVCLHVWAPATGREGVGWVCWPVGWGVHVGRNGVDLGRPLSLSAHTHTHTDRVWRGESWCVRVCVCVCVRVRTWGAVFRMEAARRSVSGAPKKGDEQSMVG
jgi:hypothetical protein